MNNCKSSSVKKVCKEKENVALDLKDSNHIEMFNQSNFSLIDMMKLKKQ